MRELWEVWWLLLELVISLLEVQEASEDQGRESNLPWFTP